MKKITLALMLALLLSGCIEPSSKPSGNQGANLVILNAYGLDYLIEDEIIEIERIPDITTTTSLLDYSVMLQKLHDEANPDKKISVVIDRHSAFIKIRNCTDGCVLQDHQSFITSLNNKLLSCMPTFSTNDDVSSTLYSKEALAINDSTICGIKVRAE